jgi:hypothetical protein
VDIAIDLMAFTKHSRPQILAHRPAPLAVNYLGYPGSMGAPFIDYIIADPTVVPPDQEQLYAEKVVWLPDCYQVNDRKRRIAEHAPSRREAGPSADSTTTTRSPHPYSTCGCGSFTQWRAASCGCCATMRPSRPTYAGRPPLAASIPAAWCLRRERRLRSISKPDVGDYWIVRLRGR